MKKLLTACFILVCLYASAQDSVKTIKPEKPSFQTIAQAGWLAGENNPAYQVQSINGLQYKTFFAGAGVGIDDYLFRSIPVFIDVRKDVFDKPNTPFLFADAGSQFAWQTAYQKGTLSNDYRLKGKFYMNAGAGYKLNIFRRNALQLSAAFSLKRMNGTYTPYCDLIACPEAKPVVDKYTLRRLSLMIGWMIW